MPAEGLNDLAPEGFGHRGTDADIGGRAAVHVVVKGAEEDVPQHEVFAVVFVSFAQVLGVVPAV